MPSRVLSRRLSHTLMPGRTDQDVRKKRTASQKKWPPWVKISFGIVGCLFSLGLGLPLLFLGSSGMVASSGWGSYPGTLLITDCQNSSRGVRPCDGTFTPDDSSLTSTVSFSPSYAYEDAFHTVEPGDHVKVRVWPESDPFTSYAWASGNFSWAFALFLGLAALFVIWPFPAVRLIVLIRNLFQRQARLEAETPHSTKREED